MSNTSVPEPWASRMIAKGFTDPRYTADVPSLSRLADKVGIHASTLSAAIQGTRKPSVRTIELLVRELGPDVGEWLGSTYQGPWQPPDEASLMDKRQRDAVTELIRSFVTSATDTEPAKPASVADIAPTRQPRPSGPSPRLKTAARRRKPTH